MKTVILCVGILIFGLLVIAGIYGFLHNLSMWGFPMIVGVAGITGCLSAVADDRF